jgi:rhodanese-related sulfurtransferase
MAKETAAPHFTGAVSLPRRCHEVFDLRRAMRERARPRTRVQIRLVDRRGAAPDVSRNMKALTTLVIALAFSAFTAVAATEFPDISHDELKKAMKENKVTLIDVNGNESYQKGHIPGSINYIANEENLGAKLPKKKDALIVAYCGNERCKAYKQAAIKAKELGYTNVKHYSKGIAGWKSAGEKTQSDS